MRLLLAYLLYYGILFLLPLACAKPSALTDLPEAPVDTAAVLQKRLQAALDSLDGIPKGCTRDTSGTLFCPDIKPTFRPPGAL